MSKYYRVYADINLDAIVSNVEELKSLTKAGTKALAVVKADGYGHGDIAVSRAVYEKVYGYAVATLDEAVNLRDNGIDKPILVLGYTDPDEYDILVDKEISATVFDFETATALNEAGKKAGKKALCNIKIDTGMRRIGLEPDETGLEAVRNIKKLEYLDARGIFTHFAASDEKDKTSAKHQLEVFTGFIDTLQAEGITFEIKHCSNSAAIIDMPEANLDMVRMGIALYGMYPSEEVDKDRVRLAPAIELKSHVTMVKELQEGERISYGGTYTTTRRTVIATVSVGYGDGYPRALSSKGCVLIKGMRAPIVGRVCMDQLMVDVTEVLGVARGDVVTLVGHDGNQYISVEEISALAGTFNYEFVCDLGKRIPRNYYYKGQYIGSHDYFHEKWTLKNI